MIRVLRFVAVIATACVLAACSASDFKEPIIGFGKATNLAAEQFDFYNSALNEALAERTVALALASSRATYNRDDCHPDATGCTLIFVAPDGSTSIAVQSLDGIVTLMRGVKNYAGGLTEIVTANTNGEVDAAITAVKTNLLSLAKSGDTLSKQLGRPSPNLEQRITTYASPIANAAAYGLNKVLEGVKLAALRQATTQMEALMPELSGTFDLAAETAWVFRRNNLHAKFRVALVSFNRSAKTKKTYEALEKARAEYDAVLRQQGNAGAIFRALATAHSALDEAVHNPQISPATLLAAIQRVSDEAVKLASIANEFREAQKQKKEKKPAG